MIKKTLYVGSPAYISTRNEQLVLMMKSTGEERSIPIEDIGTLELDHPIITITSSALHKLATYCVAVVACDDTHLPAGMMLPFDAHSVHTERQRVQHNLALPLKKKLWQQTVRAKIRNQAALLQKLEMPTTSLYEMERQVRTGDTSNREGMAAAYYWKTILPNFKRDRFGEYPNNLLNYGYSLLRTITARALIASGLHPSIGIFHKNKYNPFCLADDIMEPYRPFSDERVMEYFSVYPPTENLTSEVKRFMLTIPSMDVRWKEETRPLMIAMQLTCSSLYKCLAGEETTLLYPELIKK